MATSPCLSSVFHHGGKVEHKKKKISLAKLTLPTGKKKK